MQGEYVIMKKGFDANKYIEEQSKYILERIKKSNSQRLYLEFGGKLVHDKHAMRCLPGFDENAKIKLLHNLKDQAEVVICIYAGDITTSKVRHDFGITYDLEVLRLIDIFRKYELPINSVVITRYQDQPAVNTFIKKLNRRGITTYKHYFTKGYPTDVDVIVSEEGYGKNPYIKVTKPLVFLIYYNLIWEVTKMKKFLLLAVLAVSASAFAANDAASLVGELQALDAEYQNLANQEEARFNEEKAQADAAKQALAQNEQVYNELSQRAQRLQAEANTRFYKSQYQDLASKYEDALKKLEAEMEQQKGVISDFEKIQALRAGN